MADEGFHEIQLKGKQLVFLFMASTVVAVVIFLCGVMVGRGVPVQRGGSTVALDSGVPADPTAAPSTPTPPSTSAPLGEKSPASGERLTYPERLEGTDSPEEPLEPVAPKVFVPRVNATPEKRVPEKTPERSPLPAVGLEPPGNGFVVQVAAVNDRREAEKIAGRLAGKGYQSFVSTPAKGTPRMFRVRIGKYKERRQAELIADRLQKEEQFKPWVTR